MADIDIEEHDLLENPVIKRIFPDLSILKKEIIDFTEEFNFGTINSEGDLNTITASNTNSSCGNKKNLSRSIKKKKNIKNSIVILDNIGPFLNKSKRFCQICLILFPDNCSLGSHNNFFHYNTNVFKDNLKNDVIIKSDSIDSVVKNSSLKLCAHCDVLFSRKEIIDHLYDVLNAKKKIQDVKGLNKSCANVKKKQCKKNVMITQTFYCCPICSSYFESKNIYSQHLLVNHHVSKKIPSCTVRFSPICKFCYISCSNTVSYNIHLHLSHKEEINKKQNLEDCLSNVTTIMDKHSESEVKDITNTEMNQMETNNNSEVKVSSLEDNFITTTLFKCMKCKIFFLTLEKARNHNKHCQFLIHWKCLKCLRIFKAKDSNKHEKQHHLDNYFIESAVFNNNCNDLYKCQECTVYYKKKDIFNHQNICDSTTSSSSYCEICDILIEKNIYISHRNSHKLVNVTNSQPKLNNDHILREKDMKSKKQSVSRVLREKHYFRDFFFCNICECNIPEWRKVHHLKVKCMKLTKNICEYCGLAFAAKSIVAHRRFHKKYPNLKLQDFAFYDLQTKRAMKPRQTLPKCNNCEKHFIHDSEIINHLCEEENNFECFICNIKLSAAAFKLHIPFHTYKLKSNIQKNPRANKRRKYKNVDLNFEDNTVVGRNIAEGDQNMDRATHDDDITHLEKAAIYTCINCNVSMTVYDEVIGHCHMHNDLNNLHLDSIECATCKLNFVVASYNAHQDLHISCSKDQFKQFTFDVLYFGSKNDTWIKHLFGSLPTGSIDRFIKSSIYKDECRMKLEVTQQGLAHLTIYKCDKCKGFVDSHSIYKHMASCCTSSEKFSCKFCDLPFVNRVSRNQHEVIHSNCIIDPKSYRIVTFNREEDKALNIQIANIKKYYVLYQCRFCNVVVDKRIYDKHKCYSTDELKKCSKCGLVIHESEYNLHISNHNSINSFNKDYIYVNLLGSDNKNKSNNVRSKVVHSFSGMISDYTFFKCAKCEICVRDHRSTVDHFCLINAAKSECPKCDLVFDEGKLKGHLRLHETDPYFTKDTIMVKTFGEEEIKDNMNSVITNTQEQNNLSFKDAKGKESMASSTTKLYTNSSTSNTVKIFKCLCGLHFLNKTTIREHSKGCSGKIKIKQSKQNCLKCGLTFSNDILFQHLLKHHKGKNVTFEYDIVEM